MGKKHCTAIVLAAGQGKRMGTSVQKQYIELDWHPLIYYTLQTFEDSRVIDDIVLVVGPGQEDYVYQEIVRKYYFTKIKAIVPGGKERYDSVWNGLKVIKSGALGEAAGKGYVFIHDGARIFADEEILERGYETVEKYRACVAGMPSKDTVKLTERRGIRKRDSGPEIRVDYSDSAGVRVGFDHRSLLPPDGAGTLGGNGRRHGSGKDHGSTGEIV